MSRQSKTKETALLARELYAQGLSTTQVAKQLGIGTTTAWLMVAGRHYAVAGAPDLLRVHCPGSGARPGQTAQPSLLVPGPVALVSRLGQAGVRFERRGDDLAVRGRTGSLTPELLAEVAQSKAEILALLEAPPAKTPDWTNHLPDGVRTTRISGAPYAHAHDLLGRVSGYPDGGDTFRKEAAKFAGLFPNAPWLSAGEWLQLQAQLPAGRATEAKAAMATITAKVTAAPAPADPILAMLQVSMEVRQQQLAQATEMAEVRQQQLAQAEQHQALADEVAKVKQAVLAPMMVEPAERLAALKHATWLDAQAIGTERLRRVPAADRDAIKGEVYSAVQRSINEAVGLRKRDAFEERHYVTMPSAVAIKHGWQMPNLTRQLAQFGYGNGGGPV